MYDRGGCFVESFVEDRRCVRLLKIFPVRRSRASTPLSPQELKDGARRYEGRVQSGSQAQGRGVVGAPADPVIVVVAPTHPEAVANDTSPMSTSGAGSCDAVAPPEETTRGPRSNGAEVRSGDAKGEDPGGSGHQFSPKEDRSSQGRGRARAHAVAVAVAATVAVNGDDDQVRGKSDHG